MNLDSSLWKACFEKVNISISLDCLINSFSAACEKVQSPGGGALSTCTYGEVSPIFLGQNISRSDIFGSK